MICRYCGSELPGEALFCGECGRAVLVESLVGASVGASADDDHARFAPAPDAAPTDVPAAGRCPQCDSRVEDTDVFCGECGFVLKAVVPGPRDTAVVEPEWPFAEVPEPAEVPADSAEPLDHDSQPRKEPAMPENDQEPATDLHPDAGDGPGRAAVRRARWCATRPGNDRDRTLWC